MFIMSGCKEFTFNRSEELKKFYDAQNAQLLLLSHGGLATFCGTSF
jgi:hypothetical protein